MDETRETYSLSLELDAADFLVGSLAKDRNDDLAGSLVVVHSALDKLLLVLLLGSDVEMLAGAAALDGDWGDERGQRRARS